MILGTVVVEGLHAAQTRGIIDNCFAATQTRIAANPLAWQLPWTLTLLASAPLTRWTGDGITDIVALMVQRRAIRERIKRIVTTFLDK